MSRHTIALLCLAVLVGLTIVGCNQKTTSNVSKPASGQEEQGRVNNEEIGIYDDKIVIGAHLGKSGPVALIAEEFQIGWDTALQVINEKGVYGRKLELLTEDDNYSPAKALAAVKKLIDRDRVFAVTGIGTAPVVASLDYVKNKHVPYLFPLAGHYNRVNSQAGNEQPYLFMAHPDYATQLYLMTDYVIKEKQKKKIAIIYQNDDVGDDVRLGVQAAVKSNGLILVAEEGFERGSTDFSAQVQKVKNAGADAVVLGTSLKEGTLIVKEADKLEFKPLFYGHTTFADKNYINLLGPLAEGSLSATFLESEYSEDQKVEEYLGHLQKYHPNAKSTFFTMYAYSTMLTLADALQEAGESPTREKLMNVLTTWKDHPTELMGTLTFQENDQDGKKSIFILEAKDGKWVPASNWLTLPKNAFP